MASYYFLASLLPELEIGHVPKLSFEQLMALIKVNVQAADQELVHRFLRVIDIENFLKIFTNEPIDPRGNLSREQLQVAIDNLSWSDDENFAFFIVDFFMKYPKNQDRIAHFAELKMSYFQSLEEEESGFLANYARFQRELQLTLTGFRAKLLHRDLLVELQYEDAKDPIVAQILAQKDSKNFEPPFEYQDLKPIFEEFADQPLLLQKELVEYQFRYVIENWGTELFSIERVLNYLSRLILVERWLEMDVQKGMQVVDKIEREVT